MFYKFADSQTKTSGLPLAALARARAYIRQTFLLSAAHSLHRLRLPSGLALSSVKASIGLSRLHDIQVDIVVMVDILKKRFIMRYLYLVPSGAVNPLSIVSKKGTQDGLS